MFVDTQRFLEAERKICLNGSKRAPIFDVQCDAFTQTVLLAAKSGSTSCPKLPSQPELESVFVLM